MQAATDCCAGAIHICTEGRGNLYDVSFRCVRLGSNHQGSSVVQTPKLCHHLDADQDVGAESRPQQAEHSCSIHGQWYFTAASESATCAIGYDAQTEAFHRQGRARGLPASLLERYPPESSTDSHCQPDCVVCAGCLDWVYRGTGLLCGISERSDAYFTDRRVSVPPFGKVSRRQQPLSVGVSHKLSV